MNENSSVRYILRRGHPYWQWGALNMSGPLEGEVLPEISEEDEKLLVECVRMPDVQSYRGSIEDLSRATDCINTVRRYPIVNDRFRGVIEPLAGDDLQFLPMTLVSRGKPVVGNWWVVNFLRRVECIDYEITEYTQNLKKNRNYISVVVHSQKIPSDARFFRINGFLRAQFVHASVRSAIRKAKLRTAFWEPLRCSDLVSEPE